MTMTSPAQSFSSRFAAEKALLQAPAEQVLSALIPFQNPTPGGGIWSGSGSAQLDAKMGMPSRWQIFYSINRVWDEHARAIDDDQAARVRIGKKLLEFLPRFKDQRKVLDLISLEFWIPEAEPVFARLLDSKDEGEVAFGAEVLSQNVGDKYHAPILRALRAPLSGSPNEANFRRGLLEALIAPRRTQIEGLSPMRKPQMADFDFAAIESGFDILQELEARSPGNGYFLADTLGSAVNQHFAPDQTVAKYRNNGNLTSSFFSDTSRNALEWWKAHGNTRPKDLQP